ncbi:hypothetical protein PRUPE_3G261900 [Prunus persica]|uniref:Plastid division regulator MinE n=1 Tax=Prunus persica TaxID=3760 RepID=A0A251Q5N3_PRUPE|nr:cell division topological specificity factor homolog, chloroplastic [Prunus persica]ONI19146.1 hypothetical protein PRUPE_3G261900 [Prunus persica]
MAISGELGISAILGSCPFKHHSLGSSLKPSKVTLKGFNGGGSSRVMIQTSLNLEGYKSKCQCRQTFGIAENSEPFPGPLSQETEGFLLRSINMSFFERLNLAWKIVFPSPSTRRNSNAKIAKQRLQMILFSDRCAVTDDAKEKIVSNIVGALSDFVEIESQDNVQLSVSTDEDLGTVYSVTIPVRRVKPEYHQDEDDVGVITNDEYKDIGEHIGSY